MKKTHNINISGYAFVIDEDAYEMLERYLDTLEEICRKTGEKETATDIELRIAELFIEKLSLSGHSIITLSDVEEVIDRMGSPEEILEVEVEEAPVEEVDVSSGASGQNAAFNIPRRKRLYRDVDDRVLGGVCSGLGWYFGIDPVWVRVIAVAGAFLSVSTLAVIYIILWIVVPPARTPYERMQMMGMNPSMENVGKVVTGEFGRHRDAASGIGRIFLMILVCFGLLITGSILLGLCVAFIGCFIALLLLPFKFTAGEMVSPSLVFGLVMGSAVVIGFPLLLLFRTLIGVLMGRPLSQLSPLQNMLLLIGWIVGLAAVITCGCLV